MKRRRVLGLLGAGAIGLAGCAGDDTGENETGTPRSSTGAEQPPIGTESPTEGAVPSDASGGEAVTGATGAAETTERQTAIERTPAPLPAALCLGTGAATPAETPGDGWPRVAVDPDPSPYDETAMEATVVGQFTDDCPATVRVSLTNVAESPISGGWGWSYPFSAYWNEDGEETEITLLPVRRNGPLAMEWGTEATSTDRSAAESDGHSTPDGTRAPTATDSAATETDKWPENPLPTETWRGCWNVDLRGVFDVGKAVTVAPGETISEVYGVYNSVHNEACLPAGEYRFVQDYYGGTHDSEFDESWGITLSVEY